MGNQNSQTLKTDCIQMHVIRKDLTSDLSLGLLWILVIVPVYHRVYNWRTLATIYYLCRAIFCIMIMKLLQKSILLCPAIIVADINLKAVDGSTNKTVRFIRTDNGTEFVNQVMSEYYKGVGIFHQKSISRTPQQNSVDAEKSNTAFVTPRNRSPNSYSFSTKPLVELSHERSTLCYCKLTLNVRTRYIFSNLTIAQRFTVYKCFIAPIRICIIQSNIKKFTEELHTRGSTPKSITMFLQNLPHNACNIRDPVRCGTVIIWRMLIQRIPNQVHLLGMLIQRNPTQVTQPPDHLRRWTKDHPLDNIVGNPSRPVSTKKQLASDALWCCFHTELSKVKPKNFKMAVIEDYWFQATQDEIHKFD
ncbi:retrovirus-related pol polyprotein from transposon TNT 1-94 [Tanacetum coccineum]